MVPPRAPAHQPGPAGISVARPGNPGQHGIMIDPEIESHYDTGYERSRLFPGGRPRLAQKPATVPVVTGEAMVT